MPVGIIMAVGAVASAAMAADASNNASDNALRMSREADPFREQRPFYQEMLKNYMMNPTKFSKDPTYNFLLSQGSEAVRRAMGPGYGGEGGNVLGELQRFGQQNAFQYALPYYQFLGTLGGANYNNPSMGAAANAQGWNAQNQINAINQGMSGLGVLSGSLYGKYGQNNNNANSPNNTVLSYGNNGSASPFGGSVNWNM